MNFSPKLFQEKRPAIIEDHWTFYFELVKYFNSSLG